MPMHRTGSREFDNRRNTDWIGAKGFWLYYALLLLAVRALTGVALQLTSIDKSQRLSWTIINILHSIITFYIMHWMKGTPFWIPAEEAGKYDRDTFWEQIDLGRQYTVNRKVFTLIPLILFLLAAYDLHWDAKPVVVNFAFMGLAVIPKLAALHHVRLMGINKD